MTKTDENLTHLRAPGASVIAADGTWQEFAPTLCGLVVGRAGTWGGLAVGGRATCLACLTESVQAWIEGCIERTARKHYSCVGSGSRDIVRYPHASDCPQSINPGERYVEFLGESPAYESGSRHTLACARRYLRKGRE